MTVLETSRLTVRQLTPDDAEFVLRLLNEESFLRFVGDRGVRTLEDARKYILDGPIRSYERHGYGLSLVELKGDRRAIGICGLLNRDSLDDVDIGFALLPEFWGNGYAYESASAMLAFAVIEFDLDRVVAVTKPDNAASIRVLEKLGMRFERMVRLSEDATELQLFATSEQGGRAAG